VIEAGSNQIHLVIDPSRSALPQATKRFRIVTSAREGPYPMMDFLMLALAFGFFALAIGYTYACERL
jgi:hypothetical protein